MVGYSGFVAQFGGHPQKIGVDFIFVVILIEHANKKVPCIVDLFGKSNDAGPRVVGQRLEQYQRKGVNHFSAR